MSTFLNLALLFPLINAADQVCTATWCSPGQEEVTSLVQMKKTVKHGSERLELLEREAQGDAEELREKVAAASFATKSSRVAAKNSPSKKGESLLGSAKVAVRGVRKGDPPAKAKSGSSPGGDPYKAKLDLESKAYAAKLKSERAARKAAIAAENTAAITAMTKDQQNYVATVKAEKDAYSRKVQAEMGVPISGVQMESVEAVLASGQDVLPQERTLLSKKASKMSAKERDGKKKKKKHHHTLWADKIKADSKVDTAIIKAERSGFHTYRKSEKQVWVDAINAEKDDDLDVVHAKKHAFANHVKAAIGSRRRGLVEDWSTFD